MVIQCRTKRSSLMAEISYHDILFLQMQCRSHEDYIGESLAVSLFYHVELWVVLGLDFPTLSFLYIHASWRWKINNGMIEVLFVVKYYHDFLLSCQVMNTANENDPSICWCELGIYCKVWPHEPTKVKLNMAAFCSHMCFKQLTMLPHSASPCSCLLAFSQTLNRHCKNPLHSSLSGEINVQ